MTVTTQQATQNLYQVVGISTAQVILQASNIVGANPYGFSFDQYGNIYANIIPRTGTRASNLQTLAGGVGELGSFVDYPGTVQFNGVANQAAVSEPNGHLVLSTSAGATVTISYLQAGKYFIGSTTTNDSFSVTLPSGFYVGQVVDIVNTTPITAYASTGAITIGANSESLIPGFRILRPNFVIPDFYSVFHSDNCRAVLQSDFIFQKIRN